MKKTKRSRSSRQSKRKATKEEPIFSTDPGPKPDPVPVDHLEQRTTLFSEAERRSFSAPSPLLDPSRKPSSSPLDPFYRPIQRAIEKMNLGFSHLLFVKGKPGIGKSFQIERHLKRLSMPYAEISGDVSEAYLYRVLYENNGKVIWFKDVVRLLRGLKSIDLLKNATETRDRRVICNFNYSDKQRNLPPRFEFTGKLIFDFNSLAGLKFHEDFEALSTRGDFVELAFTYAEMAEILRKRCRESDEQTVTEFLIQHYRFNGHDGFNLRTQERLIQTYRFAKSQKLDWQTELRRELRDRRSPVQSLLYPVLGDGPVRTKELKRYLVLSGIVSTVRTADRRIADWLELGELFKISDDHRNFHVSLVPVASIQEPKDSPAFQTQAAPMTTTA